MLSIIGEKLGVLAPVLVTLILIYRGRLTGISDGIFDRRQKRPEMLEGQHLQT